MPTPFETHIENLNIALSQLKATGEEGFEGLIAVALYTITGIPFRLANSGYQRGVDGKAAFEGAVAFEGKLYTNDLPRKDVLSKIPDLVRHNDYADLVWVLGATCTVPAQLADDLRADGAKEGIGVFVLDWVPSDFPRHEQAIRDELDAPAIATAMAEKANIKWFGETLSKKALARTELGQPLAPNDAAITVLDRDDLVNALSPYFTDDSGEDVICVHGEEGCGKSWIAIHSWLAQSDKPLLIFTTPVDFTETATQEEIEERLISKLIAQTGALESEKNTVRWRRRLKAWKDTDKPSRPRFVLVIDGINQRPGRAWGRIIDNVATYVNGRGGRVIFSARTHYFDTRVKRALNSALKEIIVPKWTAAERDEILNNTMLL